MTLEFYNGSTIEITSFKRSLSSLGGMVREKMTVSFPLDGRSIDTLYGMFTEDACQKMTITEEDRTTVLSDFVIRDVFRVITTGGIEEVTVSMVQMTYIEKQLAKLGV